MAVTRINFLTVPLDVLLEEEIETTVLSLLEKEEPQQIIFVSLWDVLKARRNYEFKQMLENAALCLPISKSLIRGARFLKLPVPVRRHPFNFIISILNVIDSHYKSLYLFGGRTESVIEAEKNVHVTFPGISIVGRFNGYYRKNMEKDIISAIIKSNPSLVIVGNGITGGNKWIYRNRAKLHGGIFIKDPDVIDIFSKQKKRISDKTFEGGREFLLQIVKNPFKIFYFFRYVWYNLLLLFYRFFRTNKGS
ncbi:MAG: WecB/TagA/CpsF family glycosyltransferase [Treponema phagedenis]|uniref:WecB/TagA/CpsF family glycosyltransferase n=1 Tax=Treponema phagedenis TaxID=162 RepID=UPI0031341B2B